MSNPKLTLPLRGNANKKKGIIMEDKYLKILVNVMVHGQNLEQSLELALDCEIENDFTSSRIDMYKLIYEGMFNSYDELDDIRDDIDAILLIDSPLDADKIWAELIELRERMKCQQ